MASPHQSNSSFDKAIGAHLIADTATEPAWRSPGISSVCLAGQKRSVGASEIRLNPFTILSVLRPERTVPRPLVLLVMAMSGHQSFFLRDLALGLLTRNDVAILDWVNARHVPLHQGDFGFSDNIAAVAEALRALPRGTHLVGVCQGTAPAIAAASALHQIGDPKRPASLCLIGGPVDPAANPSRVSTALAMTPISWLEYDALEMVGNSFPGAGRKVYPAARHQRDLLTYLRNQLTLKSPLAHKVANDDGAEPQSFPFLSLYSAVKDISGKAFLESIAAIFHDRALWTGRLRFEECQVRPQAVSTLPLLTIEASQDDIALPGQTIAAHDLFASLPSNSRRHLLLEGGDHFSLLHGEQCRNTIAPAISGFIEANTSV